MSEPKWTPFKRIYLQAYDDDDKPVDEITWCQDRIEDNDEMYYHQEYVEALVKEWLGSTVGVNGIIFEDFALKMSTLFGQWIEHNG